MSAADRYEAGRVKIDRRDNELMGSVEPGVGIIFKKMVVTPSIYPNARHYDDDDNFIRLFLMTQFLFYQLCCVTWLTVTDI